MRQDETTNAELFPARVRRGIGIEAQAAEVTCAGSGESLLPELAPQRDGIGGGDFVGDAPAGEFERAIARSPIALGPGGQALKPRQQVHICCLKFDRSHRARMGAAKDGRVKLAGRSVSKAWKKLREVFHALEKVVVRLSNAWKPCTGLEA
ncbi:MAG: hypothetical protein NTY53_12570 [Kiritimatiellaeota bacterium]|nr:hypothetical protein [Kiritimatiellota bacterium]